jgi:hypothetical protein
MNVKDDTTSIRAALLPLQASAVVVEANVNALHTETRSVKDDTACIRDALPPLQTNITTFRDAQSWQQH